MDKKKIKKVKHDLEIANLRNLIACISNSYSEVVYRLNRERENNKRLKNKLNKLTLELETVKKRQFIPKPAFGLGDSVKVRSNDDICIVTGCYYDYVDKCHYYYLDNSFCPALSERLLIGVAEFNFTL